MGSYVTRMVTDQEIKDIIESIAEGFTDNEGIRHKPNRQVATILTLQANLGCRIGDICALKTDSFMWDGDAWTLNITEQKTGKERRFIVPKPVKAVVDKWCNERNITDGSLFSINEYAVWKQLRAVTASLDMENVSAHSFRKAAGYRIYTNSGNDLSLTTDFYQHSSPAITQKYLRRTSKQMDEAIKKSVILV